MIKRLSLALLILTGGLTAQAIGYKSAESIRAEGKTKIPKRAETWFVDKALIERSRLDPAGGQRVEGLLSALDRVNIVTETPEGLRFTVESKSLNDRVTFLNGRIEGSPESIPARLSRRFRETVLNDRGHFAVAPTTSKPGPIKRGWYAAVDYIFGDVKMRTKDLLPGDIKSDVFNDPSIGPKYSVLHEKREFFISNQNNVEPLQTSLIKVRWTPEGYEILNGHHEWLAAKQANIQKVKVTISHD